MSSVSEGLKPLPSLVRRLELSPADHAEDQRALVINLFDEVGSPLLRYVASFGLPRADAEDILQETFLSLLQHIKLGRPQNNMRAWLFRVAHNLSLKRLRAKGVADRREHPEEIALAQQDPAPLADQELMFRERHLKFATIMGALSERDRRCIALRAEGLRYREIAKILGISLGSVSMSISRTLGRMLRAEGTHDES